MSFEVKLPDAVIDEMSHLPLNVRKHIANEIKNLEEFPFPHGTKIRKIQSTNKPIYRLRVGDYRVVYNMDTAKRSSISINRYTSSKAGTGIKDNSITLNATVGGII